MRVHHFRFHYCSFGVGVLGVAVDDVVVVDGVAGDVGDAVGRHGDPLGDRFLAEPLNLCKKGHFSLIIIYLFLKFLAFI